MAQSWLSYFVVCLAWQTILIYWGDYRSWMLNDFRVTAVGITLTTFLGILPLSVWDTAKELGFLLYLDYGAPSAVLSLTAARRAVAVAWAIFQRKCFTSLWCLVTGCRNTVPTSVSVFQAGGVFLLRIEINDESIFMWCFWFVFNANLFNHTKMHGELHFLEHSLHQVAQFLWSLLEAFS